MAESLKALQEAGKTTYGADSPLVAAMRSALQRITGANMLRLPASMSGVDKLRIDDRAHAGLLDTLRQHAHAGLKADYKAFEAVCDALGVRQPELRVAVNTPGETAFLEGFAPVIYMENSYQAEIPRLGVLHALGQGKQLIFSAMSILSLVMLLFRDNWRQHYWIVLVLFALFIGSVIWSVRNSRHATQQAMEQHAERARETLLRDLRRLISDVGRERGTRLQQLFDGLRRDWSRALDEQAAQQARVRNDMLQRQRNELRERLRLTDSQLRDITALGTSLQRCSMTVVQGLRDAERGVPASAGLVSRSEL